MPGLLYFVLDEKVSNAAGRNLPVFADTVARAGADIIQFRPAAGPDIAAVHAAKILCARVHNARKIFIVNNRADVALLSDADGVHLGAGDIAVADARKILGKSKIIGKTVHSLRELRKFQEEEVDYLSIGPLFPSRIKPNLRPLPQKQLKALVKRCYKPLFAIGGINEKNISTLRTQGIHNIAVCRAITGSRSPTQSTKRIKRCLQSLS
jgi:thiamine-phosphate pyrophosphorylase